MNTFENKIIDIQFSARLALNNYCNMLDEKLHYIPYFYAFFEDAGAIAQHCEWDFGDATGRYLDALLLCREIAGTNEEDKEAEEHLKAALEWMISEEDGLCYRPRGLDWVNYGANMFDQRSALLGLLSWYFQNEDEKPYRLIKGIISGLTKVGVEIEDYLYFPMVDYVPGMKVEHVPFDRRNCPADPCHYGGGVTILPLAIFYEKTKDEDTLYLMRGLTNFIVERSGVFKEDGSFWTEGYGDCDGHFHSRMGTVAGILRYAMIIHDIRLMKWCKKVYDWACTQGTSYGLFPEGLGERVKSGLPEEYPEVARHSEICCTTDMIHIALYLSRSGLADYWDHAEKYLNHLVASQLKDISWVKEAGGKQDTELVTYRNVPQRYLGAFTGRTMPNDLLNNGRYDTMGCCVAAGGRGLYLLWNNAVDCQDEKVYVNLWTSYDSPDVKVSCAIPVKGEIRITVAHFCDLYIRIPNWLDYSEIQALHDNKDVATTREGGYVVLTGCRPGSSVVLKFPLVTQRRVEQYCGVPYEVHWRGNAVIAVEPKGKHIPLY